MLQSIRDRTQGWIAGIIISLLILSFALWGIHSYMEGGSSSSTVAEVNGVEITKGQLSVAYERLRRQLQMQYSSNYAIPPGAEAALKERALKSLVSIQLLKQASIDQNYRVSERQVDSLLESMPDFQVNGQFSLARFQQVMSNAMYNAGDFIELLKTSLLIDQPRLGLIYTSFALPNEVAETVALVNQERSIKYAVLSSQTLLKQLTTIPKSKIEAYYKDHQNNFKTPEQVSVDYLELSISGLMASLHPSDAELQTYYNENSTSFSQPMKWKLAAIFIPVSAEASEKDIIAAQSKIDEIAKRLSKGEDFGHYASQYPLQGKDREKFQGMLALNQVPQALQKTVSALTKPAQMSPVVKIEKGFVILKANQIQAPQAERFELVKDKVKSALVRQQAEEKFASMRDKLANSTYEHPESLQAAAQSLGLQIKSSAMFTKAKGDKDISSYPQVREVAFSNDVLNVKNNSDLIQLGPDKAIVLRVKTYSPATTLALSVVENQIVEKLKAEEAEQLTLQLAKNIQQKLSQGVSPDQLAQQYNFNWTSTGFIGRHVTKVDSAILNEAFSMPKPKQADHANYSIAKVPAGYAVIALNDVRNGALSDKKDQYDMFSEQIQNAQGMFEYELYKLSLEKQSKIKIENQ